MMLTYYVKPWKALVSRKEWLTYFLDIHLYQTKSANLVMKITIIFLINISRKDSYFFFLLYTIHSLRGWYIGYPPLVERLIYWNHLVCPTVLISEFYHNYISDPNVRFHFKFGMRLHIDGANVSIFGCCLKSASCMSGGMPSTTTHATSCLSYFC